MIDPTHTERRVDHRFPLKRTLRFELGSLQVEGQLQDISRSGLKLRATDLPPVSCTTLIQLPLGPDAHRSHGAVRGQVMWTSRNLAGIRFVEPEGSFLRQVDALLRDYLLLAEPTDILDYVEQLFDDASFTRAANPDGHAVLFDLGPTAESERTRTAPSKGGPLKKHDSNNGNGSA